MNPNTQRFAIAAVIVLLVIGGGALFLRFSGEGGIGGQPVPIATTAPTATPTLGPTPTPTPTRTPAPTPTPMSLSKQLDGVNMLAGTYVADGTFTLAGTTFTVGDGWSKNTLNSNLTEIGRANPARTQSEVWIALEVPQVVYADPCKGTTPFTPATGPTIDDFIADLRRMPHFTVGPTSATSVGGLPATTFDFTNDIPYDGTGCQLGVQPLISEWDTGDTQGGLRQQLTLVDVYGTRLLIDVLYTDPTPTTEQTVQSVIDSIRFP